MTLVYVTIACFAGIVAAALLLPWLPVECGLSVWLWLAPATLLPFTPLLNRLAPEPDTPLVWAREFGFRAPRSPITIALLAACALAMVTGALRFWGDPIYPCLNEQSLAAWNVPAGESFNVKEGWQVIEGYVASHVAQTPGVQRITVAAEKLGSGEDARPISGKVTLRIDADTGLHYGDGIRIAGVLSTPAEFVDFSWRDWLARRDILSAMSLVKVTPLGGAPQGNPLLRWVYLLRSRGEVVINAILPEPHAALANGMLLGIDANIPDALMEQFNDTSASHVIVISGSNIALIAGVLMALGTRFGRGNRWIVWITLFGIGIYAVLVGAEASVVRAAIMGGLLVIATALNRRSTAVVSLAAATLAMTLADPHILWDVGFQLSAVATLGLILLVPALRPATVASESDDLASAINPLRATWAFLGDTLAVSLAATLAVTPLLIWHFQRLSVIGLLTNLLIVPVQPLILISGLAGLIVGMVGLLPVARLLFAPTWLGLAWTVGVVQASAQVRWASLAVGGVAAAVLCGLCVLIGVLLWRGRSSGANQARTSATTSLRWQTVAISSWMTGALAILGALAWLAVAARADGMTHVWFLPAERGQAVLIQSPSGRQVLVDGGDDGARLLSTLGGVMGFWDRSLDALLLTVDNERTAATQATLANRLRVDIAYTPLSQQDEVAGWVRLLAKEGVIAKSVATGSVINIDDGLSITLHSAAEKPGAIEVRHGNLRVLLPGSTDSAPALLFGDATAVSIPDLGRADAEMLAQHLSPDLFVVYGEETFAKARYPNIEGVVHLRSDGESLWIDE